MRRGILVLSFALATGCAALPVAADFTLKDTQGRDVHLADFKGKVVLLDFWQTYCEPCKTELPHVQRLYEKLKGRGLVVLGISMDDHDTVNDVAPFVQSHGLTFPILLDPDGNVAVKYDRRREAPVTVLIDRTGKIARTRFGYDPGEELQLESEVVRLLGQ